MHACIFSSLSKVCMCVCVSACGIGHEKRGRGFAVSLQSDGGGRSEGGQAVITNSIHFRNNNTAL